MRQRLMMLPFGYHLEHYPFRKRNATRALVRGDLPVRLRECDDAEAPVGITLVRGDFYDRLGEADRARYYPDGPPAHRVRHLDGVPLVPLAGIGGAAVGAELFESAVARPRDSWVSWGFVGPVYQDQGGWGGEGYPAMPWYGKGTNAIRSPMELPTAAEFVALRREIGEPVRLRGDDRAACEAQAGAVMASALVVVDGQVWKAAPGMEPHWEVVEGGDDTVKVEACYGREPMRYVHRFPLDALDRARAFASARATETGRALVDNSCKVEIHDPSVIRMDEAVETARQFLSHIGRDELDAIGIEAAGLVLKGEKMTPAEAGEAYAMVRRAVAEGALPSDDARLSTARMAALERFAGLMEARPELRREAPDDVAILAGLGR